MNHLLKKVIDNEIDEFVAVQLMYFLYTVLRRDNIKGTNPF